MTETILAIDQGTTSTRAFVFTPKGEVVASSQLEHKQIYPEHGWVEHNVEEIWQNILIVCNKAIKKAQEKDFSPVTIGITNQRETIIAWDKITGKPLHNAIVWQDKRTVDRCSNLKEKHGDLFNRKTGLPMDAYFSASKMEWLLENVDAVKTAEKNKTLAFGTIDSFLLWKLTDGKVHATDITNASRTLLFNIHECEWDRELLDIFNVPMDSLPKVMPNTADFGVSITQDFLLDLPVQSMIGDQQSASIGQTCFKEGMLKSTYGTGCFAMLNTGKKAITSKNGLITTIAYQLNDDVFYALEGSIFVAGAAVQWLRDSLGIIDHANETEELAINAGDDDNVYFVPAFAGVGAPYWNSHAKAAIVGMTLNTNKATIVRSALDAVALQTNDLIDAMKADTGKAIHELRVDGGMVVNGWLMQRMADILNVDIALPEVTETTALGAAYLAGLKYGLYNSLDDISKNWHIGKKFLPSMDDKIRQDKLINWHNAVMGIISSTHYNNEI